MYPHLFQFQYIGHRYILLGIIRINQNSILFNCILFVYISFYSVLLNFIYYSYIIPFYFPQTKNNKFRYNSDEIYTIGVELEYGANTVRKTYKIRNKKYKVSVYIHLVQSHTTIILVFCNYSYCKRIIKMIGILK